jgi:tetraether lipid synthase
MTTRTQGLCNECGRLTDAEIVIEADAVHLVKSCPEHGETRGLVCSDRAWYEASLDFVKPGTEPKSRAVDEARGCPDSCGLCPDHQQHTCVPILEITDRCDLECPICLVEGTSRREMTPPEVEKVLDDLVAYEGRINMLTLSGGEPTRHPHLMEILDAVRRPEIGIVSISTNGLALLEQDGLIEELRDRDVIVSLQYDGATPETYKDLRGRPDLAEKKREVIERVLAAGGRLSLTATIAVGVNEHEIPGILDLLFRHDGILSVMVQPLAYAGRAAGRPDAMERLTVPDLVRHLAAGSSGVLTKGDFTPLPCSHPTCFALTYVLKTVDGGLVPLPSILERAGYLDVIKNQALMGTDRESLEKLRDSLYALWSSDGIVPRREAVLQTVREILLTLDCGCGTDSHRETLATGTEYVKSVFIHQFMDRTTFDLTRAKRCCNHYPQVDGRLLPACIRNVGLVE